MPYVAPMTSVTCSACSQIIVAENDRVYCFGGCEQILHIRCSELRPSDSIALRNNVALQYMCFACRKKQISLNDLQTKYSELLERMDDVCATVSKYESCMHQLEENLWRKIETTLIPSLVEKIESMLTDRGANQDRPSYATVTRGSRTPTVIVDGAADATATKSLQPSGSASVVNENLDEGWTLRSGKRRIGAKATVNGNAVNGKKSSGAKQATRAERSSSSQVTTTTGRKFEQTVIIKPKESQQADLTQKHIREKIDPIDFSVKGIRSKDNGDVVVRCETSADAQKLVTAAVNVLSDDYEISILQPLKPRVKIVGLSEDVDASELVPILKKQNGLSPSSEITLIRMRKIEKRKNFPFIAILETDAQTFETLIQRQRVNIRWDRCRIVEDVNVYRCFKCSRYGHKASSCGNPTCCPVCAGDHDVRECDATFEKCINCELKNKQMDKGNPYDELLSINHSAWSPNCPIYQKRVKAVRQMVDYSA